jgi:hypothetical protein
MFLASRFQALRRRVDEQRTIYAVYKNIRIFETRFLRGGRSMLGSVAAEHSDPGDNGLALIKREAFRLVLQPGKTLP